MKKYLSLAFAFMLVLGMSFPALMADAYFEEDSKKENIIKTELSDTSLSDEAISFLAENNISLDSKVTPNSEVMSEGNGNTEYIGVLNEEILALKNAAQAYGFTQQQIQAYVEGILNTPTTVIFEEDSRDERSSARSACSRSRNVPWQRREGCPPALLSASASSGVPADYW